ncbi:MAG: hypothetical protein AB7P23_04280, partial [Amphiplicatus sp.]
MFERFQSTGKITALVKRDSAEEEAAKISNDDSRSGGAAPLHLKVALHQRLIDKINLNALEKMTRDQVAEQIAPLVRKLLAEE